MSSNWLEKCCGCVSLKIGSFILGYLLSVIDLTFSSLSVHNLVHFFILTHGRFVVLMWIFISCGLLQILCFGTSIVLLVGLHTRKSGHIEKFYKIYPIFMGIYYVITIILLCLNARLYDTRIWMIQSLNLVVILLKSYTLFVVFRRVKEMKTEAARDGVKFSAVDNTNTAYNQNNA